MSFAGDMPAMGARELIRGTGETSDISQSLGLLLLGTRKEPQNSKRSNK
jgi:hypothetical protein